ncbi:hypothetical protein FF38_07745 [Lucilia cuprina]|uniref:Fibronectin type-III domain-containing protein n=1 Tax=Lucilia cuprina TaxID=7375 RepID=A0A0L0CE05_LUCCU|nr:hypothetical protein FF38_07745 [Lucilia cuprina]
MGGIISHVHQRTLTFKPLSNHQKRRNIARNLAQKSEIKANITSTIPRFTVSTLSPGGLYTLSVYAFNSKGRSDPTILSAAMLRMPEKQLTFEPGLL